MSRDYTMLELSSAASSNKVLKEGSGSISVGAIGVGETFGVATIPHGQNTDNLLFQVTTNSGYLSGAILPWQTNDGRVIQYATLDSTNLYIYCISSNSGSGSVPAFTVSYFYRILAP